ncbi:DNA helicase [Planococcus sp. ANT_H30]|uniref:DEAD/DEAH box helicase family protein n=1 Tax=Planococcus sp. ANT_H30 TaxID=2597347 RepID=UPI0011EE06D0|nr:DEAD/DEAH box helicase family protein [Planococcus sp. ANT_H30]KAA0957720.1 DNA helicase [Planococcus sp. ANT_H30]
MRVSEVVTIEEIESWNIGDVVTIEAGTGSGKSYFIKNNLYAIAKRDKKRILMLIHRTNCVNQFQMEIEKDNKTDVIDIMTYQSIEYKMKNKQEFNFDQYDIICADEMHYFFSDASYNKYTDLSLEAILKQTNKIRIFMSATSGNMQKYINKHKKVKTIDYKLPIDFSFIQSLEFYANDETLDRYAKEAIELNRKTIFFIQSAKKAYEFYEKYKDFALFNCSKNNADGYYQHVNAEKINNMLKNERFEESILITTTVMDAGVNIIDDELSHIVADVSDTGTLIQCIGRKRLKNKEDKITLRIKVISGQSLGGRESQTRKKVEMAAYFTQNGQDKYIEKYYRELDQSHIIYDELTDSGYEKRRNDLMFFKAIIDVNEIEAIKGNREQAYCKYIASIFHIKKYSILEDIQAKDELKTYLERVIGRKLFKNEQKELVEKICLKDSRGRLQKGISLLNEYFKLNKMNYLIVSKRTNELKDGKNIKVGYWEVLDNIIN